MLYLDVKFRTPYNGANEPLPRNADILYIGECADKAFVEASTFVVLRWRKDGSVRGTFEHAAESKGAVGEEHIRLVFESGGSEGEIMAALVVAKRGRRRRKGYNKRWPRLVVNGCMMSYSVEGRYMDFNHYRVGEKCAYRDVRKNTRTGGYTIVGNYVDEDGKSGEWGGGISSFGGGGTATANIKASEEGEVYACHTKVYVNNAFLIFGDPPFKNRWRKEPHAYTGERINVHISVEKSMEDRTKRVHTLEF